jgi:hypothetical protein
MRFKSAASFDKASISPGAFRIAATNFTSFVTISAKVMALAARPTGSAIAGGSEVTLSKALGLMDC